MPTGKYPEVLTYWAPTDTNEYAVAGFAAPLAIHGRWEDRAELVRDLKGDEFTSAAVVFVDQEVAIDGYLARGDFSDQLSPDPNAAGVESWEIKQVKTVRNMRYSEQEIKAYL
jgi:hypothetical protein